MPAAVNVKLDRDSKGTSVACAANVGGPGLVGSHHRAIETNREQHRPAALALLLFESSLDLFLKRGIRDVAFVDDFPPGSS
jgi:hypothetical protein